MFKKIREALNNKKKSLSEKSENSIKNISGEWDNFVKKDTYLTNNLKEYLEHHINTGKGEVKIPWYLYFDFKFKRKIKDNLSSLDYVEQNIQDYNTPFVQRKIKEHEFLFKLCPHPLDLNQKIAIVTDDNHNLVVAGAGSGKTEVLTTRIAYLIKRNSDAVDPKRILALAFQNKASKEIEERLMDRYGINTEIKTFHALGKKILEHSSKLKNKKIPTLMFGGDNATIQFSNHIKTIYQGMLKNKKFQEKVFKYMESYSDEDRSEDDFETKEEYFKYKRDLKYTTLNNRKVKSRDEREILNFFLMNKINNKHIEIIYEKPAEWMVYKNEEGEEKIPEPDFFFPEYNIYWEHWALNEKGEVPDWFEGENPTEEYIKHMELKKKMFKKNKDCILIETTHADFKKDNFKEIIKEKISEAIKKKTSKKRLSFIPLDYEELVNFVWYECKMSVKALSNKIAEFITIAKTYNLSSKQIESRLKEKEWAHKQIAFGEIALDIFSYYEKELKSENKIDFADMINLAIEELNNNEELYKNDYDHILIDEYQDLSYQRYKLIEALMKKNSGCKLFCVGDDWQGIMGFSGANLDFFVNFKNYFRCPARTDLIMNYRSRKSIVDTGAEIIKGNKNSQLQKETIPRDNTIDPIKIYSSHSNNDYAYYRQVAEHCVQKMIQFHKEGYKWNDMMILSRIVNNPMMMNELKDYAREQEVPISSETIRSRNSVPLMSVHGSKGLQAKIVFILNVNEGLYGFPCQLENPDIYEPARLGKKKDIEEEERRLFYVAITRAKEKVIIYTQNCSKSKFLKEIKRHVKIDKIH